MMRRLVLACALSLISARCDATSVDQRISVEALAVRAAAFFPGAEQATITAYRPLAMLRRTDQGNTPDSVRTFMGLLRQIHVAWVDDEPRKAAALGEELEHFAAHGLSAPENQAWFPFQVSYLILTSLEGDMTPWTLRSAEEFHLALFKRIKRPLRKLVLDYVERHDVVVDMPRVRQLRAGDFDREMPFDEEDYWRPRLDDSGYDAALKEAALRMTIGAIESAFVTLRPFPGASGEWVRLLFEGILHHLIDGAVQALNAYEKEAFSEGKPLAMLRFAA